MSGEDQVKVRHVRLCQCGMLADHPGICRTTRVPAGLPPDVEVERVDAHTEERYARESEAHDHGRLQRLDRERRNRRGRMSELELHVEVASRYESKTTVAAGNIEPSRGGGDRAGPPRQQTLSEDPRWRDAKRIVRRRLMTMLDLLDEADGVGHAAAVAAMDKHEKDRILLDEGRGLIAEQVVAELGPEYGSASYIRRLRRSHGLDTRGYPKEPTRQFR